MDRPGHEQADFFIGKEVELSPAFMQQTLFVVGVQDPVVILKHALEHKCPHIYLGANQSFEPTPAFESMLMTIVRDEIMCTLDFDVQHAQWVLETGATEYDNFIPMISVKLPHIQQLGYNATIKLDDVDFKASNPGVWCHRVHDLMDKTAYTPWRKYTQDEVIK